MIIVFEKKICLKNTEESSFTETGTMAIVKFCSLHYQIYDLINDIILTL